MQGLFRLSAVDGDDDTCSDGAGDEDGTDCGDAGDCDNEDEDDGITVMALTMIMVILTTIMLVRCLW